MTFSILMPILTVQATNVRMYSCGLFFMTAAGLCMIELFREKESLIKWILLGIFSACSVYCHTFQMIQTLLLYGFFFVALLYKKQYHKLKGFFACGIFTAVVYLPWLKVIYDQMQRRIDLTTGDIASFSESENRFNVLITYCKEWFTAGETPYALVMYLGMAIAIVLGYFAVDYMRRKKDYAAGMGLLIITITALIGTYLNGYVASCFMGRYVFFSFGSLALMYALGIQQIRIKWLKVGILAAALYCFVIQYTSELDLEYNTQLEEYLEFVEQNVDEDDLIMIEAYYLYTMSVYYPDLNYMAYGHLDEWMPFEIDEAFTSWDQLEDLSGTLWYIGYDPNLLSQQYDNEKVLEISHMYYDIELYQMIPKE